MNSLERVIAALNHKPVDRVPVTGFMTMVTSDLMKMYDYSWLDAHYNAEKLVELAAAAHVHCGLDTMKLPFDMTVEAEALGGKISMGSETTLPQIRDKLFDEPGEFVFDRDLLLKGRIPLVLKSIKLAKSKYSPHVAVTSSIVGPFSLGTWLFGVDDLLIWSIEEPEKLHAAMEKLTKLCIMYAKEQVFAGADVIQIGEAAASGDLLSPTTYRDFIAPYHKLLCAELSAPSIVHICGNITGHFQYIADTGMMGISFDKKSDANVGRELLKGKVALVGYVDVLETLLKGTAEEVYAASRECLEMHVDCLNPGCSLPAGVPMENISALVRASIEFGTHPK